MTPNDARPHVHLVHPLNFFSTCKYLCILFNLLSLSSFHRLNREDEYAHRVTEQGRISPLFENTPPKNLETFLATRPLASTFASQAELDHYSVRILKFKVSVHEYTRAVDGQENLQLVPCKDGFLQLHRYKIGLSRHARHTCVKQLQAAGPCLAGGVGSSLPSLTRVATSVLQGLYPIGKARRSKHRHKHRASSLNTSIRIRSLKVLETSTDVVHVGLGHSGPVTISCSGNMLHRICIHWDTRVAQIRQCKRSSSAG